MCLLQPLEVIVGNDDSVVREKATKSLSKVAALLTNEQIRVPYMQMVDNLQNGEQFSQRIAASQLYAEIYSRLPQQEQNKVIESFKQLCSDDTPMVRWGAAQALSTLCEHVS